MEGQGREKWMEYDRENSIKRGREREIHERRFMTRNIEKEEGREKG